jgi:cytochrome c oxidase subunit 2
MIGWINVMEAPEYQAWLSGGGAEGSLADAGQRLFQQLACNTCHRSDGSGRGPALEGIFGKQVQLADGQKVLADEAYLRESITEPRAKTVAGFQQIMPTFKGQVSEEQLLELIAYIRSISSGPAAGGSRAGGSGSPESQSSAPAAGTSTKQGTR